MDKPVLERKVKSKYGVFRFELIDYPGPSPLVDVWLDMNHLGYCNYFNLEKASDIELLQYADEITYPVDSDVYM